MTEASYPTTVDEEPPTTPNPPEIRPVRSSRPLLIDLLAWLSIAAFVVGVAVALWPVNNPDVQDCGAPAAYIYYGKVNRYPDAAGRLQRPDGSIDQLSDAARARAVNNPCSRRVSGPMVSAGLSLLAGALFGLIVLIASMIMWWRSNPPIVERS